MFMSDANAFNVYGSDDETHASKRVVSNSNDEVTWRKQDNIYSYSRLWLGYCNNELKIILPADKAYLLFQHLFVLSHMTNELCIKDDNQEHRDDIWPDKDGPYEPFRFFVLC